MGAKDSFTASAAMFLATARRVAAMPLKRQMAAPRGFATWASPRPLSFRMDGLFAKCMVAAVIHFAPLDIVLFGGLCLMWHKQGTTAAPKAVHADAASALEAFQAKKGLDKVNTSKGRSTWHVTL